MKSLIMNWVRILVSLKCHVSNHSSPAAHVVLAGISGLAKELLTDFADSLPGIDEAKSFMQVMG